MSALQQSERVIVRRRRRRRPWWKRRRLRQVLGGGAALLLVVAGWHYWVLYEALQGGRSDLRAAQTALGSLDTTVNPAELAAAGTRLESAEGNVGRARAHLRWDPLISLGGWLPVVGDDIEATRELTAIGDLLVEAGAHAIAVGEAVQAASADESGKTTTGAALELLDTSAADLARIDELVTEAQRRRGALDTDGLAGPLHEAAAELDRDLPSLAASIRRAQAASEVLPAMLGYEGDRRYLALALNNGEIMPGGGLVTAGGILAVRDGELGDIDFWDATGWRKAWEAQDGAYIEPPGPLKRYLLHDYSWNLLVSNWSPEFDTWSRYALDFYEKVHGEQQVDGVLAVDLAALEALLGLTGPVELEVDGELVRFTPENVVIELERLTRPGERDERKSVIGDLTEVVLRSIQDLPSSRWPDLARTLDALIQGGHVQATAFAEAERRQLVALGVDGAFAGAEDDTLMVSEASVLGTKLSLVTERESTHRIRLDEAGTAHHELTISLTNTLPDWAAQHDPELVDALMGDGVYGGYLQVFVPEHAHSFAVRKGGADAAIEDSGVGGGRRWVGYFTTVHPGERVEVTFSWAVPRPGAGGGYSLVIEKQPGMWEYCTAVTVMGPGGQLGVTADHRGPIDGRVCLDADERIEAGLD